MLSIFFFLLIIEIQAKQEALYYKENAFVHADSKDLIESPFFPNHKEIETKFSTLVFGEGAESSPLRGFTEDDNKINEIYIKNGKTMLFDSFSKTKNTKLIWIPSTIEQVHPFSF